MPKLNWPTIHAWALYDFAATAFSMNMISTYFALWVNDHHAPWLTSDLTYGLAKSISMFLVVLISPLAGALSDRSGNRQSYLAGSVVVFVLAAIALGFTGNLALGLLLFGFGNIAFQLSSIFYNAMLPALVPSALMGRVSGYGKMVGYFGSLVAVLLGMAFATGKLLGHPLPLPAGGSQAVFIPTAIMVGLAALPLCLSRRTSVPPAPGAHPSWGKLIADLRDTQKLPGVGLFLLASFFFFDTVNTIRDFMSLYMVKVVGLSETGGSLQKFLLVVVLCSLVGAFAWGFITDRFGAKPALMAVLSTLAVGFVGLIFFHSPGIVLGVIGPLLGVAFGGVLVTTRPLMSRLVPGDRQGEFFGLFVLSNDFAAILGPVTWGLVVQALSAQGVIAYQAALGCQLFFLLVGLGLLSRVPAPRGSEQQEVAKETA